MKIFTHGSLQPLQLNRYTEYYHLKAEGIDAQLVEASTQPHIMEFEHEDSKKRGRFGSEQNIHKWMSVGRFVYTLMEDDELRGISWFRDTAIDEFNYAYRMTFGIRLYEGAVGKGMCLPFMHEVHADMLQFRKGNGVWLSAKQENFRAINKYEQYGYQYHHRADGLVYMVNDDALVL